MCVKAELDWHRVQARALSAVQRTLDTLRHGFWLGFTAFGGPAVHFKIFHDRYVEKLRWVEEQMFQELFSVCTATSGPGSTKMLWCIYYLRGGLVSAFVMFLFWSLPGALGMYALANGVSRIGDQLPEAAYAVLSGLNAATVGIIALAAVQLSGKAITDRLSRILVFFGAAAGMLYTALWYFPLLLAVAGLATVVYDARWLHGPVRHVARLLRLRKSRTPDGEQDAQSAGHELTSNDGNRPQEASTARGGDSSAPPAQHDAAKGDLGQSSSSFVASQEEPRVVPADRQFHMSWKAGLAILLGFAVSLAAVLALRGALHQPPLLFSLFANLYLAGTIIFGGGPVVIPLLREYVVQPGWVSPRDFLIGVALIQAWPGPNFNFAVYLGCLAALRGGQSSVLGALCGFCGIFVPGLVTSQGLLGIWSAVRGWRVVKSALRGINATAVGLIYTAVYKLWQIGWLDAAFDQGTSLANDPWWVVVTATAYVGGQWFGLSPPVAIALGAVLGLVRYGVVSA